MRFEPEHSETCFADETPDKVVQFDFDAVDRGNPLTAIIEEPQPEHYERAGEAFGRLLAHMWRGGTNEMQAAFRKFVTISALVRPDLLDGMKMPALANRLGCTKQCLSEIVSDFRDEFGDIQFRNNRSASSRARMKAARLKQVAEGRGNNWAKHRETKITGSVLP